MMWAKFEWTVLFNESMSDDTFKKLLGIEQFKHHKKHKKTEMISLECMLSDQMLPDFKCFEDYLDLLLRQTVGPAADAGVGAVTKLEGTSSLTKARSSLVDAWMRHYGFLHAFVMQRPGVDEAKIRESWRGTEDADVNAYVDRIYDGLEKQDKDQYEQLKAQVLCCLHYIDTCSNTKQCSDVVHMFYTEADLEKWQLLREAAARSSKETSCLRS